LSFGIGFWSVIIAVSPWSALSSLSTAQWVGLSFAATIALAASLLRAYRTKILLDFARVGPISRQFLNLGVGSLINAAAPMRIGEVLRSYLLAKQLRIGLGFSLVAIALERLVDVVVVMTIFLVVAQFSETSTAPLFLQYASLTLAAGVILLIVFVLAIRQNRSLLGVLWKFTNFWNPRYALRLKLSFWTLLQGFLSFFRSKGACTSYGLLSLLSWGLYFLAVAQVFLVLETEASSTALVMPFVVPESLFRVTDLHGLILTISQALSESSLGDLQQLVKYVSITWLVLNVPIAFFGFIALCMPKTYSPLVTEPDLAQSPNSISKDLELEQFLDSFFKREAIAKVMQNHYSDGTSHILKFFKGGSNALTTLSLVHGEVVVRKVVPKEFKDKLRMQFEWLKVHSDLSYIVSPIRQLETADSYAIDLEYSQAMDMFSWLHESSVSASKASLTELLSSLGSDLYKKEELTETEKRQRVSTYLEECLFIRLSQAEDRSEEMRELINSPSIEVNGKTFDGLRVSFDAILQDPKTIDLLSSYKPTRTIHGDLTIDNLLVDEFGKVLVIDPSDDNAIRGPIIDYSRLLQSLEGGYEFLNQLQPEELSVYYSQEKERWVVHYPEKRSARYAALSLSVRESASMHLSPLEIESLDFHISLLFARMLNHRVKISPETAPAYLATSLIFLERFTNRDDRR
jgi:uncharacterized protein (TIRG00374 family)